MNTGLTAWGKYWEWAIHQEQGQQWLGKYGEDTVRCIIATGVIAACAAPQLSEAERIKIRKVRQAPDFPNLTEETMKAIEGTIMEWLEED